MRITPARAGKTFFRALSHVLNPNHPRACGENSPDSPQSPMTPGSPPRVRGKRVVLPSEDVAARITPACAGKTTPTRSCLCRRWDHPRVCGENSRLSSCAHSVRGSPPRVRGKLLETLTHKLDGRITPACAGKTHPTDSGVRRFWDHPRVCGENVVDVIRGIFGTGSPPRVRGKRAFALPGSVAKRITPACAGKTR